MTDDEVDVLLSGVEDSQGQVQYEGISMCAFLCNCAEIFTFHCTEFVKMVMSA